MLSELLFTSEARILTSKARYFEGADTKGNKMLVESTRNEAP